MKLLGGLRVDVWGFRDAHVHKEVTMRVVVVEEKGASKAFPNEDSSLVV